MGGGAVKGAADAFLTNNIVHIDINIVDLSNIFDDRRFFRNRRGKKRERD